MPWTLPLFLLSLQLILVFAAARMTMVVHQDVSSYVGILRKYAGAFTLLETTEFTSEFNRALKETLHSGHADMPGLVIRRLSALLNMLDANLNMLVSVILNGLFMFNIHVVFAVERWRKRHRLAVPVWFSVLAEFDALSGLAAFTFNNPGYTFPEPVGGDFTFVASALGHPLIHSSACVTNDIEITGWNQFRIITGANMSGKSTFLRSVGTNLILAIAGAPVFAGRLTFLPVEIHSSIRTNDSLAKRESYFYAELRRLKEMIADLEQGRQKLILLDEILKGTNSSDKQTGSVALIRQLLKYPVTGLFATHDLSLGELVHNYPGNIRNLCFEIRITGDRMEIDYKLVPGVSRNLNASYLMRKMGIIPDN
jgi:DNA mismatch repair ATPase MutS